MKTQTKSNNFDFQKHETATLFSYIMRFSHQNAKQPFFLTSFWTFTTSNGLRGLLFPSFLFVFLFRTRIELKRIASDHKFCLFYSETSKAFWWFNSKTNRGSELIRDDVSSPIWVASDGRFGEQQPKSKQAWFIPNVTAKAASRASRRSIPSHLWVCSRIWKRYLVNARLHIASSFSILS